MEQLQQTQYVGSPHWKKQAGKPDDCTYWYKLL